MSLFRALSRRAVCLLLLLTAAEVAHAQCDTDDFRQFRTRPVRPQDAPISVDSASVQEGSVSVTIPLSADSGSATLALTDSGFTLPIRVPVGRFTWSLRARFSAPVDPSELLVNYIVSNGSNLVSNLDASSRMQVTVTTNRIEFRESGPNQIYEGWIDLWLDPTNASRSGAYSGSLQIEVSCQ